MYRPYEDVDSLIHAWGDVVVPIYVDNKRSNKALTGIGSGVILIYNDQIYLATALHVAMDAKLFTHQIMTVLGQGVHLGGLGFFTSKRYDIAIAHLSDQWLHSHEVKKIRALPIEEKKDYYHTGLNALMGFPASQNKLDTRFGKTTRNLKSFTLPNYYGLPRECGIQDALLFPYDPKGMVDSNLIDRGLPPALYGMSGGPALKILRKEIDSTEYRLTFEFAGILCEWHRQEQFIAAAPASAVIDIIQEIDIFIKTHRGRQEGVTVVSANGL